MCFTTVGVSQYIGKHNILVGFIIFQQNQDIPVRQTKKQRMLSSPLVVSTSGGTEKDHIGWWQQGSREMERFEKRLPKSNYLYLN